MKYLTNTLLTLGALHYLAFAAEKLKGLPQGSFSAAVILGWMICLTINLRD